MSAFTLQRDAFQRERRRAALEPLRQQYAGLRDEIASLRGRLSGDKHHDQIIENDLLPVLWRAQECWCKLSAIESEMFVPYALAFAVVE